MKKINLLARHFLAAFVALAVLGITTAAYAEDVPQVVTIVKIDGGPARYSTDNKNWHTLHRGDVLKPGSVIQTSENSTVDVVMGEHAAAIITAPPKAAPRLDVQGVDTTALAPVLGRTGDNGPAANAIRIFPSSVLSIDKLEVKRTGVDEVSETQLDLRAGQIMGDVKKLSASSHYEVKIPNGVAGIRGTVYFVGANGVTYVLEGQVIISYVNSSGQLVTATVKAGESFNPFKGADGTTAPIPPLTKDILLAIQVILNILTTGNPNSPNTTTVAVNGTTIHISAQ